MWERLTWFINKKLITQAIEKQIMFEISYGPTMEEPGFWKTFLQNAHNLIKLTKGRNIILSSEASDYLYCRTPLDLVAIGMSLGLTKQQAVDSISTNCELAVAHGKLWSKSYKGAAEVLNETELLKTTPELK